MRRLYVLAVLVSMIPNIAMAEDIWGDEWALSDVSESSKTENENLFGDPAPRLGFVMDSGKMVVGPYRRTPEKVWVFPGKGDVAACTYERPVVQSDYRLLKQKHAMCEGFNDNYFWYDCPTLKGRFKDMELGFVVRKSIDHIKSVAFRRSENPEAAITADLKKRAHAPNGKTRQIIYKTKEASFALGALFKKKKLDSFGIYVLDPQGRMIDGDNWRKWEGENECDGCGTQPLDEPIDFLFLLSNVFVSGDKWILLQDSNTFEGRGMKMSYLTLKKGIYGGYSQSYYVATCIIDEGRP